MIQRFVLLLITTIIPSSNGLLSASCMMEYDNGGAPAVYAYPECPNWVFSSIGSLQNQTLNCHFSILQGHRDYQEDAIACNLDVKLLLFARDAGKNGLEEDTVGMVAVFDGHGGKEASEMASKLLFDYFYLNVVFQSYKKMAQYHNQVLLSRDYELIQLEILKEALSKTIGDIDLKFSQASGDFSLLISFNFFNFSIISSLRHNILYFQDAIKNNFISGSTAIVVLLFDGKILVANVGDSKAILFSEKLHSAALGIEGNSIVRLSATTLTEDHHPDREDERVRIEAAGGSVVTRGVPRVNGVLAMSRSIGDVYLKKYGVIAEPEFTGWQLLTANDIHLVVASDGIFESLTPQDISELIFQWNSHLQRSQDSIVPFSCLASTSVADCIVNTAYEKGSHDNLSAIFVPLKQTPI